MPKRPCVNAQECTQQWQALWELDNLPLEKRERLANDDPFDCSNLITHEKQLIEQEVNKSVAKWKALDDRKVKKKAMGWSACKIRLPHNFDYLSKLDEAPLPSEQGERIISFVDPRKTDSYETELWKIFKQTKTVVELKRICGMKNTVKAKDRLGKMDINRFRMSDRHGLPPADGPLVTTIFLEVWRKKLRDSSTDCNRMVLEFLGGQTLLDVHTAIQELTDDRLWTGGKSGIIVIEDSFYITGEVDYVSPIIKWLREDPSRSIYLELSENMETKPMDPARLDTLRWSLNKRYVHIHHGHVESYIFLTDVSQTPRQSFTYPIIHDIWTPSYPAVLCEGCKARSAVLITPSTCKETDGAAQICQSCHDSLFGNRDSNSIDIHMLKQQHDLLAG